MGKCMCLCLYKCVCVRVHARMCLCECMVHVYKYFQIAEEVLHPLELELLVIKSCVIRVLGTKLSISPVPASHNNETHQQIPTLF